MGLFLFLWLRQFTLAVYLLETTISMHNDWVTIATFNYAHQAELLKARIESEGIQCNLKDENIATANPLYSNAVGGIKVQVLHSNIEKVIPILKELGYNNEDVDGFKSWESEVAESTDKISVLRKYPIEKRLLILLIGAALALAIIFSIVYYVTAPSVAERLSQSSWCLSQVDYKGKGYVPHTTGLTIRMNGGCPEDILFIALKKKNIESAYLPGFNCNRVHAMWFVRNDSLIIQYSDDLKELYNGNYAISFDKNNLVLKSVNTILYCNKEKEFRIF